ncbi:SPOR domain-containing protein [Roseinatronobacter monicus]|uniref:SPOR domain-containing protein n=1 Tax=Roseinatronobacter monicus TaxID=393481 RepID=UPI003F3D7EC8
MKSFWIALGVAAAVATMGHAQTNGLDPAELPPAGFEGREYVDSRGCVFLRSTFGGEVTWVPRYGPDRQPVCNGTPSADAIADMVTEQQAPIAEAAVADAPPAEEPVVEFPRTETRTAPVPVPQPRAAAPVRQTPARTQRRPALPRADASGRHPSCPASAPFGQLVDTTLGRPLVRCVTSPALFLDPIHNGPSYDPHAPIALPDGGQQQRGQVAPAHSSGNRVQVGSFNVPANASRLRARLQNAGLPAQVHRARGYDVVTLGPFGSASEAHAALGSVRGMGFSDAFIRR